MLISREVCENLVNEYIEWRKEHAENYHECPIPCLSFEEFLNLRHYDLDQIQEIDRITYDEILKIA